MKTKELKALNEQDLDSKMLELRKELMKIGSQVAIGTVPKSPGKVKELKRTVAKIITIKNQNAAGKVAQMQKGGSKKE